MIIDRHECISMLLDMKNNGINIDNDLSTLINEDIIPNTVIEILRNNNDSVIMFYERLNNKAHKVIKELFECDGKQVSIYLKIATSLITQSIITIEHDFKENVEEQNTFIKKIGLNRLSEGISEYFNNGNSEKLVKAVMENKKDIKNIFG